MQLLKRLIIPLLLFPQFAFAAYAIPLNGTTTSGTILAAPTKVNSTYPGLMAPFFLGTSTTATSTINAPLKIQPVSLLPYIQVGADAPYGLLSNDRANFTGTLNDYSAVNSYNLSNGTCATADITVANDLVTNFTNFGDLGHTSSNFDGIGCTNNFFPGFDKNSTYLFDPNGDINFALGSTTNAAAVFKFFTAGYATSSLKMTILNNGNLGLASSSPFSLFGMQAVAARTYTNNKLFVIGSSTSAATTTLFTIDNTGIASTTGLVISNTGGSSTRCLQVGSDGTVSANASACGTGSGGNDPFTHASWNQSATTSAIGIGTTTPFSMLSVSTTTAGFPTASLFAVASNTNATLLNVLGNGNVGIGTTSPYGLLSVNAPNGPAPYFVIGSTTEVFKITPSATPSVGIGTTSPWGMLSLAALPANTSPLLALSTSTASATTTAFIVDVNGKVGIGTSSPMAQLNVIGTASTTNLTISGLGQTATNCLQITALGVVQKTGGACSSTDDPFTHTSYLGQTTSATSTLLRLTGSPFSFAASSTSLIDYASTTMVTATTASTTNLNISGVSQGQSGTTCLQITALGVVQSTGSACGAGGSGISDPFTHTSVFNQTTSATSTLLAHTGSPVSLAASSTAWFQKIAVSDNFVISSSTAASSTPWGLFAINYDGILGPAFVVGSSTATSFVIANNGKVGIGTSSPWSAFTLDRALGVATSSITVTEYRRNATSTTMTISAKDANQQLLQIGFSATTITLDASTFLPGQKLILTVCNPGGGNAGALTWATSNPANALLWTGSLTAPAQTTTASKCDVWSFLATQATSTTNGSVGKIFGAQTANF